MRLASWTPALTLICFRGCSGVSLGSAMSSTKSMQQRYSSSSPGEDSSSTCAGVARRRHSRTFSAPTMGERGRTPANLPWNCKQGHCLQGRAQHQCLELAPSQKIPGYGLGDGGKRAGSEGRLTASSDAQPENLREPGGCGNGAGVLGSHRWGCRKKATESKISKN